MSEKNDVVPFEILLLNDLLRINIIDTDVYNKAVYKILAANKEDGVAA